jgi:hypothetical protein
MRNVGEEDWKEFGEGAGQGDERVEGVAKTDCLGEACEGVRGPGG